MLKKVALLLFSSIILLCGCSKANNDKIYLDDKYYLEGKYIEITSEEFNHLDSSNYVLFTYNSYCNFPLPCDKVFEEFMQKYNISFLSMTFEQFRNTKLYETVRFGPSVIIVKNNQIVTYLDANKDEDLNKYQDVNEFEKWIIEYVNVKR